ncbi:CBS domain-containing protein [Thiolinea disciformis]|uniref:CBS domain-containing protein n=1 Tax=Thiolinea disciformis TaxID=125614 RepID=UPI00035F31C6|nr:CBS domain-containing protein [Thiolinea disciformis]
MKTIKTFLNEAQQSLATIQTTATVLDALNLMAERNVSAVLVLEQDQLRGIFTERDYARKVILQGKSSRNTPISEVMSTTLTTVNPDKNINACMELMTDKRVRHLPVVDSAGQLLGIVSIGDVVKEVMAEQRYMINELQRYIAG